MPVRERPRLPTGGTIFRFERQRNLVTGDWETVDAIRQMYAHGRGRVVMRAQCAFEEVKGDRIAIIVTELPYQVNKSALLGKIADLVKDKKLDGISDLRDESAATACGDIEASATRTRKVRTKVQHTALQSTLNTQLALVAADATLPLKWSGHQSRIARRSSGAGQSTTRQGPRTAPSEGLKIALDNIGRGHKTIRAPPTRVATTNS